MVTGSEFTRAVNKLAEFVLNPSLQHHAAVYCALAYPYTTRFFAPQVTVDTDSQKVIFCAEDAVYGDDTTPDAVQRGISSYSLVGGLIGSQLGRKRWLCQVLRLNFSHFPMPPMTSTAGNNSVSTSTSEPNIDLQSLITTNRLFNSCLRTLPGLRLFSATVLPDSIGFDKKFRRNVFIFTGLWQL